MEEKEWHQLVDNYFEEFCCNRAKGNAVTEGGRANLRKNVMTKKVGIIAEEVYKYVRRPVVPEPGPWIVSPL